MYHPLDNRSFQLEHVDSDGKKYLRKYAVPDHFSIWQLSRIARLISGMVKYSNDSAKAIASALVSLMQTGDVEKAKEELAGLVNLSEGRIFEGALEGVADILEYWTTDDRIQHLAAVIYLADGERYLRDEELKERIQQFHEVPLSALLSGVQDFFGKKFMQKSDTNSPLSASATMTTAETTSPA
jgi:hypothetical protein